MSKTCQKSISICDKKQNEFFCDDEVVSFYSWHSLHEHTCVTYIYMCVCVCVCEIMFLNYSHNSYAYAANFYITVKCRQMRLQLRLGCICKDFWNCYIVATIVAADCNCRENFIFNDDFITCRDVMHQSC